MDAVAATKQYSSSSEESNDDLLLEAARMTYKAHYGVKDEDIDDHTAMIALMKSYNTDGAQEHLDRTVEGRELKKAMEQYKKRHCSSTTTTTTTSKSNGVSTSNQERDQFIQQHRGKRCCELSMMEQFDMQRLHVGRDDLYSKRRHQTDTSIHGPGVSELLDKARSDSKLDELVKSAVRYTDTLDFVHHYYYIHHGTSTQSDAEALLWYHKSGGTVEGATLEAYEARHKVPILNTSKPSHKPDTYFSDKSERYYSSSGCGNSSSYSKPPIRTINSATRTKTTYVEPPILVVNNATRTKTTYVEPPILVVNNATRTKSVLIAPKPQVKLNKNTDFPSLNNASTPTKTPSNCWTVRK